MVSLVSVAVLQRVVDIGKMRKAALLGTVAIAAAFVGEGCGSDGSGKTDSSTMGGSSGSGGAGALGGGGTAGTGASADTGGTSGAGGQGDTGGTMGLGGEGATGGLGGGTAGTGGSGDTGGAGGGGTGGGQSLGGASNGGTGGSPAGGSPVGGSSATGGELTQTGEVPTIQVGSDYLKLEVCDEDIIRVTYSTAADFYQRSTLATQPKRCNDTTPWELTEGTDQTTLDTAALQVRVALGTGDVTFLDRTGTSLLAERSRTLTPADVQGEQVLHVQQTWEQDPTEALYGLGQHQQNLMNIRDYPLDLIQYNTQIVVPFFVSSRGWGVLWDNTSYTRWGDLTDFVSLNDSGGNYQGQFTAESSGDYLFRTYSSGGIRLTVDGEVVIEHWRQGWLPDIDYARVTMQAGQTYALRLDFTPDIDVNIADLSYQPPVTDPATSLWSNVGDGIDYYFVHGPEIDDVVAGYRQLTGEAPMMPKWAFGLWQCRERYETADEVLAVLDGFRSRGIPIDNIVQDWQYWVPGTWGSHEFDATRFPDPAGWIQQIHDDYSAQLMISVWPKFHLGTANFNELNDAGFIYQPNLDEGITDFTGNEMAFYDAFSSGARGMYWSQLNDDLFSLGVDAWWLDATEPEVVEGPYESRAEQRQLYETHMHPTALGSGARMLNAYSLVNSQGIYEGQRSVAPDQRVFILTRSAFAGQQRYAAASWSGDISTTWSAFKKQIPAGLNFVVSGIPYWTMDIGGFAEDPALAGGGAEWEELNTRWFQYGTFTPLLRVHGQDDRTGPKEMYEFSAETYAAHLKFDRLRYRLLPYIYSLAGEVTHQAGTIMRPLVMDFRADAGVYDIDDQYLFGPALLVNPVTTYLARERDVYLPATPGGWYDFWTGSAVAGGQTVTAAAPYDSLPLYVRAGSILPTGPELEYVTQQAADPIMLYVYAGADAAFTLYEDDGKSYAYEEGEFTRIPLHWDDAARTLTIGAREGSYTGMLTTRTFQIILVEPSRAVGFSLTPSADASLTYDGGAVSATL